MDLHLHYLYYCVDVVNRLVMILWGGRRYAVDVFYCRGVSPFPCSFYRFTFLVVGLVKEDIEFFSFLLVSGLMSLLIDIFVEYLCICH